MGRRAVGAHRELGRPGHPAVRRHAARQHHLVGRDGDPPHAARRHHRCRAGRRRQDARRTPRRQDRRRRPQPQWRSAPARRNRARPGAGAGGAGARRSDQRPRRRQRGQDPERRAPARHDLRHDRPSLEHHPRLRRDHRPAGWPHRRARHPCRAGCGGRRLCAPDRSRGRGMNWPASLVVAERPQALPSEGAAADLADLTSPRRLARAARLYGVVLDASGHAGPRHFLAELAEGAAVFALSAPGVRFLLHEHGAPTSLPLLIDSAIDPAALDAWYGALLSAPGLPHADAEAQPLAAGERPVLSAGAKLTARHVVWLQAEAPILFYPASGGIEASPPAQRLVMANQIRAELSGAGEVEAIDTASLFHRQGLTTLGEPSAGLAARLGAVLIRRDEAQRLRWRQTREVDSARARHALRRLRDVAAFRRPATGPTAKPGQEPLPGVLGLMAHIQGFELRAPLRDRVHTPLFDRLKAYATASGFRFREIALDGRWWCEEGPPAIAIDGQTGSPMALAFRRRRWRSIDPATLAES